MKYIGAFKNINNVTYRIEIITNNSSTGEENIILGSNPFVTEMNSDDKHIYSPIKGSAATIQIVTDEYNYDFYTGNPTGTTVTLFNETTGDVEWTGYVTPQMFNQSFKLGLNTIEIDAIDSLSVLDSINYTSEQKEILTFGQILHKVLSKVNIKNLYVSNNVQLSSSTDTATILDKLYISEMNFFDSKSDDETDADVCWNCLDVVSEICQFLGYVALMIGNDLWLLDYDAIKAGSSYTNYYKYDVGNPNSATLVNINHSHNIEGTDHYNSDATVSLDNIYNKVSVKADTFEFDELTGGAGEINITRTDVTNFSSSYLNGFATDYEWGEVFPGDDDPSKAIDAWVDVHNDASGHGGGNHNYYDFVACKYIQKPNSKFYRYDENWRDITSNYGTIGYSYPDIKETNGGIYIKYFTKNLDKCKGKSSVGSKISEYYKAAKNNPNLSTSEYLDYVLARASISNISWTEAILLNNNWGEYRDSESDWYKVPFYETTCEGSIIQGGDKSALIITGQFYWSCVRDAYPMDWNGFKLDKGNWINPNVDMFVPASVNWGNYWWNGESWQTTKCGFKLNWLSADKRDDNNTIKKSSTIDEWKCQNTIMRAQPLTNTVTWRFGTSEEGCFIPLPKDVNLTGKPKLTLYKPQSGRVWKSRKDFLNGDGNGKLSGESNRKNGIRWPWYVCALINLKFKALMGDPSYSDANSTDTVYTNVLENDSIEELDTIDFKIHTFDDKANSYGAVGINEGQSFVDKMFNRALHNNERTWYDSTGSLATNGMRQEEHLIYKLYNQYTETSKILECNLKLDTVKPYGIYTDTTLSDTYIVDTIANNYRYNSQSVKLIQKK